MITEEKLGIMVLCPGTVHFQLQPGIVKARSMTTLFQLMQTHKLKGKKSPADMQQTQTWLEFPGSV